MGKPLIIYCNVPAFKEWPNNFKMLFQALRVHIYLPISSEHLHLGVLLLLKVKHTIEYSKILLIGYIHIYLTLRYHFPVVVE